jgi:hypothetical protein
MKDSETRLTLVEMEIEQIKIVMEDQAPVIHQAANNNVVVALSIVITVLNALMLIISKWES